MGKKSHITKATTTSNSLRTTIPEDIAKDMDMNIGDILDWEVHTAGEKGKKYAKVRKLE
jgi:bifunctional DNA-binding transcriptional regulator/antitoxin component of YhaV-PrlF toxin-antitoxin module